MSENQGKTPPDFTSLTENLTQQQAKISALKELVRQSEQQHGKNTASAQEKVKNIAQRLSNIKSKTSRSKLHKSSSEISDDYSMSHIEEEDHDSSIHPSTSQTSRESLRARSETPGSEKISLLRKQMELNRMKMAERENKSKEIEQMVTQLKSKFESSQMSLERSVELGRSMGDLSLSNIAPSMQLYSQNRSFTISDVSHHQPQSLNFEAERIIFLEKRIGELETELSNKRRESKPEELQRLETKIMDLEENVREKESIIEARTKAVSLLTENLSKKKKDVVDSLEETKQEMFKMQETFLDAELTYKKEVSKLNRVITEKSDEIRNLNEKCEILEKQRYELTLENSNLKTKLEDVQDYSTKISELNKLNESLQKRISTLESQKYEFITEDEIDEAKHAQEEKKDTEKEFQDTSELVQKLKEFEVMLQKRDEEIEKLQEEVQEKTIDVNVANANIVVLQEKLNAKNTKSSLFSDETTAETEEYQTELAKLRQQLDDSNKNMIKTKLKMKQLQKQIDTLQKSSDDNSERARLIAENQTLSQKVAELEEEKGNYQLQLVGKDKNDTELESKIKVLEMTCQNQTTAIQLLEEQKADMSEDLENLKRELESRDNVLEKERNKELEEKIAQLTIEKEELNIKMNRYLNENMELLDKLEKLSKGSSAESIEMVNLLTAQEKMEIEQYQKDMGAKDDEIPAEISQELNESLRSLRMESSELMEKIELFTVERREVLEKLDALTIENQVLSGNLEHIQEEKLNLESEINKLKEERDDFEKLVEDLKSEKDEMNQKLLELSNQRAKLQEEINKLVKEELSSISPQASPSKTAESVEHDSSTDSAKGESATSIDKEACEKLLKELNSEIQNLNKMKDKNQKLKISKKLSDNAKNVHTMTTNLLIEFYKNIEESKTLKEDLEKVKILLSNVSSDKNNEEVQTLQKLLNERSEQLNEKSRECDELQNKLENLRQSSEESFNLEILQLKEELANINEEMGRKDDIIADLQDTIDALTSERDHCETEVQKQMGLVSDLRKEFDQLCADVKVNNQRLNEKSLELDQLQHEFDMRLKTSTNEVEILKTLVAEQKQLLIDSYQEHELDINQKIQEINDYESKLKELTAELEELKSSNATSNESAKNELQAEVKKLKDMLNECNQEIENQRDELLNKQETIDTLNSQIIELYKTMEENSNKIIEKDDELQYIQEIVDSNRSEIRKLDEKLSAADKIIHDLREKLSSKTQEFELLQQKSSDPSSSEKVAKLEAEIKLLDTKNKEQLDKLKKYAANLKKKQAQCTELEERLSAKEGNTADLSELNQLKAKILEYEDQLNHFKFENTKLNENLQQSSSKDELEDLRWKIDEYEEIIKNKSNEIEALKGEALKLSEKCDQIEENSYELQSQINKLESEKMQNQVKLDTLNNEMEHVKKENEDISKKYAELTSKDDKKKVDKLKSAVVQLKNKLAEKKKEVEDLTAEVEKLRTSKDDAGEIEKLKQQIQELDEMNEKILNETKVAYDNDIGLLKQKIDELESLNRSLAEEKQRKVSLEGQLETFEMTNIELREKVARLEEAVASLDAEKNALIREKLTLEGEIEEKVNQNVASIEDKYQQYLNNLIKQDQLIGSKLRDTEATNSHLTETIKEMNEERNGLLQKISNFESQLLNEVENNKQHISILEESKVELARQIEQLHNDLKKSQVTHEQALAAKHSELDEMESQFSSQMQKLDADKKSLKEALEKANDQIIDFQDEVIRLKDNISSLENVRNDLEREMSWLKLQNDNYTQDQLENEQLRMQLMQNETELENLRSQNESLTSNYDAEIIILRQQITDLEAMRSQVSQNQTDDQVMLQNENIKLKEMLIEKEHEIQQKSIQLQMTTGFESQIQAVNDPFASLMAAPPAPSSDLKSMEDKLKQAHDELEKMRENQMMANMELDVQSGKIQEILQENKNLQEKLQEAHSIVDNLVKTNVNLEADIETKNKEINEIKKEMCALREDFNQPAQSTDDDKVKALQTELSEKNHAIENLQKILEKYETSTQKSAPPQSTSTPQELSASMFFNDPQPIAIFDDPFTNINQQPVVEEQIVPKKAYLLYDSKHDLEVQTEECWLIEHIENANKIASLQHQLEVMEQKVMEQYVELEQQRNKICELEELQNSYASSIPQQEELIVPKKAYVCYNDVETQTSLECPSEYIEKIEELQSQIEVMRVDATQQSSVQPSLASTLFENVQGESSAFEIEDGWSWGAENASSSIDLSATQIQQRESLLSPNSDLKVKLQEQLDIIEKLEAEKKSLNEEAQNLRENSKKIMKKLKEYQHKIKELESRRGSSADSNDMDMFIQEELHSQVQKLENKLKEVISEREKDQQEKDGLLKKIDVITNANEKMIEMKERQDSQIEMYQLKIKDLAQKIQVLEEWQDDVHKTAQQPPKDESMEENEELVKKIHELNDQIKDLQADNGELQALLDEERNNIKILEKKLEKINNDMLQEASKQEHSQSTFVDQNLNSEKIKELEKQISELTKDKQQMEHELQVLNDHVLASLEFEDRMKNTVLELDAKNMEIQMLKSTLEKMQTKDNVTETSSKEDVEKLIREKEELERSMKSSIDLLNAQWSQMVEQRGHEVANSWKQHLEMREAEFMEAENALRRQLEEKTSSPDVVSERKETDNETLSKMKAIMESQEVEIVSLKEQLAIRSAEYAALSAKVDPYHEMSTSMSVSPISSTQSDKVPRSELDLALYMLHQRDMRLEEMTIELVRLLEERDQLQLRLSNAIRQIEELKKKLNVEAAESSDQSTPEKMPPMKDEDDNLKAKLSELNTVQHSRDKTITDDREKRFMEHMSMFQRDVANIPPEAAARIVSGSDHSQQSPSSVLMNWILGGKKPES